MNHEEKTEIKTAMLEAINKKYNKSFKVEYFQKAKDETYSNILTLSDGEYIFNAYKDDNDTVVSDDLIQVIVNKKINNYIADNINIKSIGVKIYGNYIFSNISDYSYEEIQNIDANDIIASNQLVKAVLVVSTTGSFVDSKELFFEIYKMAVSMNPKYIDFELISIKENDALEKMLNNLTGYYDNDWKKQDGILDYKSILDKDISSADDLVGR